VFAQGTTKPKSTLNAEVLQQLPDNISNAITPANARQVFSDAIASSQQAPQVNAQTGTSYTFLASDYGNLVTFNNAGAVAVTLPQATGSFFPWNVFVRNLGAGTITITPQGGSLINGATSLAVTTGGSIQIVSDGTNYQLASGLTASSSLPAMPADTLICNPTGSSAAPQNCTSQQAQTVLNLSQCINITSSAYGGSGNNSTDNTTPLTTAFAALTGTGGCIYFPPGKYRFNSAVSLTMPSSLFSTAIVGAGADSTILTWPNVSGGLTINYVNALNTAHVRDLSITTGQAGGGTGLTLTSTAHTQGISDIYRVTLRGDDGYNVTDYWGIGVFSHYITNLNVEGLMVIGQGTTGAGTLHGLGMQVEGAPAVPDYAVQVNVAKSVFEVLGTGILYGSYLQGLTVDQCNFSIVGNGIQSNGSETGVLAGLAVTNSQFGLFNNGGAGILTLTTIINTQITNNFFDMNAPGTNSVAIWLSSFNHFNIIGNSIGSPAIANGLDGILLGTATAGGSGVISGNDIFLFGTGINIGASATGVLVIGNTLEANTTAISNAGTGNTIVNNPGYNPVGPSALSPPAAPATFSYTASASPETLYLRSAGAAATITSISVNGLVVGSSYGSTVGVPLTFNLGPNETFSVTYNTTTPIIDKMVH
jgi:hypothetical protein